MIESGNGELEDCEDETYSLEEYHTMGKMQPSFYPQIIANSEAILVLPPFFIESEDLRNDLYRYVNQNSTKSILAKEDLIKYVNGTAHCWLAETFYDDNFCIFLENKGLVEKQLDSISDWLRKSIEKNIFSTFFSVKKSLRPSQTPSNSNLIEQQPFVLISRAKDCLMKVFLNPIDYLEFGQRLAKDEDSDSDSDSNLPLSTVSTSPVKLASKSTKKGQTIPTKPTEGESKNLDGTHIKKPLYVTDDDMYLQELIDQEQHSSAIL